MFRKEATDTGPLVEIRLRVDSDTYYAIGMERILSGGVVTSLVYIQNILSGVPGSINEGIYLNTFVLDQSYIFKTTINDEGSDVRLRVFVDGIQVLTYLDTSGDKITADGYVTVAPFVNYYDE